jgi:hypothetical protein
LGVGIASHNGLIPRTPGDPMGREIDAQAYYRP